MRRDLEAVGKWTCQCEGCTTFRSLVGLAKVLDVRPLVRAIELLDAQLDALPPGPGRQRLLGQYIEIYDKLAEVMAE